MCNLYASNLVFLVNLSIVNLGNLSWLENLTVTLTNLNLPLLTVCGEELIPSSMNVINILNFNNGNNVIIIIIYILLLLTTANEVICPTQAER